MSQDPSTPVSAVLSGEPVCACGHVYDEHDNGEECQVMTPFRVNDGMREQKCYCVYFEAAGPDDD